MTAERRVDSAHDIFLLLHLLHKQKRDLGHNGTYGALTLFFLVYITFNFFFWLPIGYASFFLL
jgi:hypothetical protein